MSTVLPIILVFSNISSLPDFCFSVINVHRGNKLFLLFSEGKREGLSVSGFYIRTNTVTPHTPSANLSIIS